MQLNPAAAAAGVRLIGYDTIGSTNAEGLSLARSGEHGPLWVTARTQTAGRGRRGRVWVSEPGNLYASLVLTDPAPADRRAELSFVAALALHDAIGARIPGVSGRLLLKWPNDLLIDGCKCAGILIEGEGDIAVVGIGVNCTHHPSGTDFPATDLAAAGLRASPEKVFEALTGAMARRLAQWDRGAGFAAVRADWLKRAASLGQDIKVAVTEGTRSGRFETVDDRGNLVLRLPNGSTETIAAGDVLLGH